MSNMARTQIYLTAEQVETLRALSDTTGRTQSDLIREGIDAVIARHRARENWRTAALGLAGMWKDRQDDIETEVLKGRRLSDERLERFLAD